ALLLQRLMSAAALSQIPWLYFFPVLAPMALYSWLALRWAIDQFQREEVLFREAERIDLRLWLRRLFEDKQPTPTTGAAFFCFGLIIGLRWLAMGLGRDLPLAAHSAVVLLAFVATPALVMALMLCTSPRQTLFLRWPTLGEIGFAALLALLLL